MSLKPYGGPYDGGPYDGGPYDGAVSDRRVPTLRFLPRTRPSLPRYGSECNDGAPVEATVRYPRARGTVNPEQPSDFEDEITLDRDGPDDFTQPERIAICLDDKTRMY